jgi:hypothetical protein
LLGRSDATDNEEDDETDEDQPTDVSSHAMPSNITMSPATSLRRTVVEVFDHQGKTHQTNIRSAKAAKNRGSIGGLMSNWRGRQPSSWFF